MKPKVGDKVHIKATVTRVYPEDGDIMIQTRINKRGEGIITSETPSKCVYSGDIVKVIPREFQVGDFVKVPFSQQRLTILDIHGDYYWLLDETSHPGTYHKQYVTRWED